MKYRNTTTNTMTLKYKGIIFDLDGTLINSLKDLGTSMNAVLLRHGLPIHPMSAYKHFVGSGMLKLVERALPEHQRPDAEQFLEELKEHYAQQCLINTKPYPGIESLLARLNDLGIVMAVLTNKEDGLTQKIVASLFSEVPFVAVVGDLFDNHRKPDPKHALEIVKLMNLDKEAVLFVGDSDVDVYTALNAGLKSCGCLWGFRGEQELRAAGVDYVVADAEALFQCLYR